MADLKNRIKVFLLYPFPLLICMHRPQLTEADIKCYHMCVASITYLVHVEYQNAQKLIGLNSR